VQLDFRANRWRTVTGRSRLGGNAKQHHQPRRVDPGYPWETVWQSDSPSHSPDFNLVGRVLGGWEFSGITNFQSGQSTTLTQSGTDPFATAVR
jgi:hypothetical protein